jgi:hypothetical protein
MHIPDNTCDKTHQTSYLISQTIPGQKMDKKKTKKKKTKGSVMSYIDYHSTCNIYFVSYLFPRPRPKRRRRRRRRRRGGILVIVLLEDINIYEACTIMSTAFDSNLGRFSAGLSHSKRQESKQNTKVESRKPKVTNHSAGSHCKGRIPKKCEFSSRSGRVEGRHESPRSTPRSE